MLPIGKCQMPGIRVIGIWLLEIDDSLRCAHHGMIATGNDSGQMKQLRGGMERISQGVSPSILTKSGALL